jgi:hypothetical protein
VGGTGVGSTGVGGIGVAVDAGCTAGGALGVGVATFGTSDGSAVSSVCAATGKVDMLNAQHKARTEQRCNNDLGMQAPLTSTQRWHRFNKNNGAATNSRYTHNAGTLLFLRCATARWMRHHRRW